MWLDPDASIVDAPQILIGGVDELGPGLVLRALEMRKHEAHAPSTAIQQQQQRVPADRTTSIVQLVRRLPVNQHSDDAILLVVPILLRHLLTIGANPREILRAAPRRRLAA